MFCYFLVEQIALQTPTYEFLSTVMGGIPSAITAGGGGVMGGEFVSFLALSSDGSNGIYGTRSGSTGSVSHVVAWVPAKDEELPVTLSVLKGTLFIASLIDCWPLPSEYLYLQ